MVVSDGGFGKWFTRALRVDDTQDWTNHTIDYVAFKARLKFFARRRSRLRGLLDESNDHRIHEQILQSMLAVGPATTFTREPDGPMVLETESSMADSTDTPQFGMSSYMAFNSSTNNIIDTSYSSDVASAASSVGSGMKRKKKSSVWRRVSNVERQEMFNFLQNENTSAHAFYVSTCRNLCAQVDQATELNPLLAREILECLAFCVCNVVTTRQVLIRYDAYARTFEGTVMRDYYLKKVTKRPTAYRVLSKCKDIITVCESYIALATPDQQEEIDEFIAQRDMFRDILKATDSRSVPLSHTWKDNFISKLRAWFLMGGLLEDRLGLEPAYLILRGQSLAGEIKVLADWREHRMSTENITDCRPKTLSGMQLYHLTLNLLSAFLYCMNYYIVEPSSTMYVNRLGAPDATQGILMGMAPLGALASSLPFSMWTNSSFRHPFIASGCLLIIGNLMYGWADRSRNVAVAMLGRFIAGLGAPKCIIRRYMADTTPMALRTSVNAGFGMVVAAGSALGPAMAILLNQVEFMVAFPYLGVFALNGLTLPGYFMACLWFVFTFIVLMTFEEPNREGLEEQILLESKGQIPGSPTIMCTYPQCDPQCKPLDPDFSLDKQSFDNRSEAGTAKSFDGKSIISVEYTAPVETLVKRATLWQRIVHFCGLITLPVRICLGLLFAKVFTIESLVSSTSILSRNRYGWKVAKVGLLGFSNGLLVIPFSIIVGRLSMSYQDHVLMLWLLVAGSLGLVLMIDFSDFADSTTATYNEGNNLAVGETRYVCGYFMTYLSIQTFEGVIGSTLSKVIPTALASGTINSGLLATMTDTFGRSCGDMWISLMAFFDLRQLMNLLFIPGFALMVICLIVIRRYRDMLSV